LSNKSIFAERHYGDVSVVVTSRFGGYSEEPFNQFNLADHVGDDLNAVTKNREYLRPLIKAESLQVLAATHGADVQFVDFQSTVQPGDGLVTKSSNLGLVALAADCATIALVDPVAQVVAVGHFGWQGLVAELPKSLANEFAEQGGIPSRSIAVLGPTICGKCYEVSSDRTALVSATSPNAVIDSSHLDIAAGVNGQLADYGFEIEQISACTAESDSLYSYRRDGITGRHALAVVIHQSDN
jgi:YfiH family protein